MKSEIDEVTAGIATLAREHGWPDVLALTDPPASSGPSILLLTGPGVVADGLTARLGPGVVVRPLEPDAAVVLAADRVVLALECGRLLTPEVVEAASLVLARPPESYLLLLTAADEIQTEEDLALVEGGIWRTLLGGTGGWHGQDLAEHRCLLWSDGAAPALLDARLARDRDLLDRWLDGPVTAGRELLVARAGHALDLAMRHAEKSRTGRPGTRDAGSHQDTRLTGVREDLTRIRRRLSNHVEASAASAERRLSASLRMLERDLIGGLPAHLSRHRSQITSSTALARTVDRYIEEAARTWLATQGRPALVRIRQSDRDLRDLLDDADWSVVNALVPRPDGLRYPEAVIDAVHAAQDTGLDESLSPRAAHDLPPAPSPAARSPVEPVVAGGALGVTTMLVFGGGLVPAALGGLAGAAGGNLVSRYLRGQQGDSASVEYGREVITRRTEAVLEAVRDRIRRDRDHVLEVIGTEFDRIESALRTPAPAPAEAADGDDLLPRIAELRRRLATHVQEG